MRVDRFKSLKDNQVKRNDDVNALHDEYQASLNGIEQLLKDKKEKLSSFHKKKLEMEKALREKELMNNGLSEGEAKKLAQEEMVRSFFLFFLDSTARKYICNNFYKQQDFLFYTIIV
jgi:hypothetical protein